MGSEFVLDRPQQPDLGDDLGGQFLIGHRRVIVIQLDGGRCGSPPLGSTLLVLLVA